MPWKEGPVMDERLRFVARLLEGEEMSCLRRELTARRSTADNPFEARPAGVLAL